MQCKRCGVGLVIGTTWSASQKRAGSYRCRSCVSARGQQWYKENRRRAAELQRARIAADPESYAARRAAYYQANKAKWQSVYSPRSRAKARLLASHRGRAIHTHLRQRAIRSGREYSLTVEWVREKLAAGVCEVTGIPFDLADRNKGNRQINPFAPSIDRIDSSKGYTPDNCRAVVWIFNVAKQDWDDADVLTMARALALANPL